MIQLFGHSDDVVMLKGTGPSSQRWEKEIGCYMRPVRITIGNRPSEPLTNGSTVVIDAEYGDPRDPELTVWRFTVRYQAENIPCRWNIEVEPHSAESMEVNVSSPADEPVYVERYTGSRWEPFWSSVGGWP